MNQQQAILCGKFTDFLILKFARHLVVLLEFYVDEFVLQHILKLKKEAAADGSKPSEASLKESANAVKLKEFNALIEFFEKFSVILNSMNSKIKMTASSSANNQKLQVTDLIHEISVLIKSATKSNPELNKHAVLIKLVICNLLNYFDESFLSSTGVKSKDLTLSKSELELPINLNTSDDIDSFEASPRPVLREESIEGLPPTLNETSSKLNLNSNLQPKFTWSESETTKLMSLWQDFELEGSDTSDDDDEISSEEIVKLFCKKHDGIFGKSSTAILEKLHDLLNRSEDKGSE